MSAEFSQHKDNDSEVRRALRGASVAFETAKRGIPLLSTNLHPPGNVVSHVDVSSEEFKAALLASNRETLVAVEAGVSMVALYGVATTQTIQNLRSKVDEFDSWWESESQAMSGNSLVKYFYELRRRFVHGDMDPMLIGYSYEVARVPIDPRLQTGPTKRVLRSRFILTDFPTDILGSLAENPTGDSELPHAGAISSMYLNEIGALLERSWEKWLPQDDPGVKLPGQWEPVTP